MFVEKSGIEATHVMVTFHAAIHNRSISLLSNSFSSNLMINPIRIPPHGSIDFAKLCFSACVILNATFEFIGEFAIVEEDVGIVKPAIEMSFDTLHRLYYSLELLISSKNNKGSICSRTSCIFFHVEASGCKDFVVFFADFSAIVSNPCYSSDST